MVPRALAWLMGAAAGAAALGAARRARSAPAVSLIPPGGHARNVLLTPSVYAAGKLPTMLARWRGALGDNVRAFVGDVFHDVPPQAIVGFTAVGSQAENTTEHLPPARASFHEIGWFQIPAGLRAGAAPNPDPSASFNTWGYLAGSSRVRGLLGRSATMAANAWKTAPADQVAEGLAALEKNISDVSAGLPASLRPSSTSTQWAQALAFHAYSVGAGGTAMQVRRYAPSLTVASEARRVGAWVRAIVGDARTHSLGASASYANPAFALLRTWQKIATGEKLADATGGAVAWFDLGLGSSRASLEQALQLAAAGGRTQ